MKSRIDLFQLQIFNDPANLTRIILPDKTCRISTIFLVLNSDLLHSILSEVTDDYPTIIVPDHDSHFEKFLDILSSEEIRFHSAEEKESFMDFAFNDMKMNDENFDGVLRAEKHTDHFIPICRKDLKRCKFCLTIFANKYSCKKHEDICRKNKKLAKSLCCSICAKSYKTKEGLRSHMKKHNQDESFKCNKCENEYENEADLKRHLKKHDTKEMFKCSDCEYETDRKDNLHRHLKSKHKVFNVDFQAIRDHFRYGNVDTSYQCPECDRIFYNADDVEHHFTLKNCEELKCVECKKSFKYKHNLKRHNKKFH